MELDLSILVWVWTFLFGLACGSFLNVVVMRLPIQGVSIVAPRSHCTSCGVTIRWYDNLPVLSYFLLGGQCRWCGTTFSFRYALVEVATGCAFAASFCLALWQGGSDPGFAVEMEGWVQAVVGSVLFSALLVQSLVDLDRRVIPDEITLPGIAIGVILSVIFPVALHRVGVEPYPPFPVFGPAWADAGFHALLGAAVGGGVVFSLGAVFRFLLGKEAMGFGDVKLLAMLGALVGWEGVLLVLVLASVAGSVGGGIYYIVRRDRYIPFGPFLAMGGLAVFWAKPQILEFFLEIYPGWLAKILG